jgi:two-component system response regulator GlrR
MKQTNILLLGFDLAGSLGGTLSEILTSVPHWAVHTQLMSLLDESIPAIKKRVNVLIEKHNPGIVFLILPSGAQDQGRILLHSWRLEPGPPLIAVLEAGEPDNAAVVDELGAVDLIMPPLTAGDIIPRVRRVLEKSQPDQERLSALREQLGLKQLIGESEVFRAVTAQLRLIARCGASIMISGETGTGKEMCARAIHYLSPRAYRSFIPVNCGAIPAELVENELFGHKRGAFTGATQEQNGLIAEADGGTLFLDELDSLPLLAQVKLLRFLQEKEYRPLGSTKTERADVRVIAASNIDFDEAIAAGKLRRDLYYRLNVITLHLPPLRERREDILLLARHFLGRYAVEYGRSESILSESAMEQLLHYKWPGNVRELEHTIARAVALAEHEVITDTDLNLPSTSPVARPSSFREAKARFERAYIEDLLLVHHGNITKAAEAAQKNRRAFWELIRKHRINVNSFKDATFEQDNNV